MVFNVLLDSGTMVIVHPIRVDTLWFLPCTYGYATTIRRAQGATYYHGCLYFDHKHPADRGYGYVAASRFQSQAGVPLGLCRASVAFRMCTPGYSRITPQALVNSRALPRIPRMYFRCGLGVASSPLDVLPSWCPRSTSDAFPVFLHPLPPPRFVQGSGKD